METYRGAGLPTWHRRWGISCFSMSDMSGAEVFERVKSVGGEYKIWGGEGKKKLDTNEPIVKECIYI